MTRKKHRRQVRSLKQRRQRSKDPGYYFDAVKNTYRKIREDKNERNV